MSVMSKTEFMNILKERIGDSTDDKDISFLENMTDTYNDLEAKANNDELTKTKQALSDLQLKYKERFFSSSSEDDKPKDDKLDDKPLTYDNLFK